MPIFTVHTIWTPLPFSKNAKNVCSSKDILLYFSPKDIISCSISALITKKKKGASFDSHFILHAMKLPLLPPFIC